jgi:hypothetical protein
MVGLLVGCRLVGWLAGGRLETEQAGGERNMDKGLKERKNQGGGRAVRQLHKMGAESNDRGINKTIHLPAVNGAVVDGALHQH